VLVATLLVFSVDWAEKEKNTSFYLFFPTRLRDEKRAFSGYIREADKANISAKPMYSKVEEKPTMRSIRGDSS